MAKTRVRFDNDWRFIRREIQNGERETLCDETWEKVTLPHEYGLYGGFNVNHPSGGSGAFLPGGIAWYRKRFTYEPQNGESLSLEFDGVFHFSQVWLNGQPVGGHGYGFVPFECDLTPYIKAGENVLAVRVDAGIQPNTRWYSGPGIYRHVHLAAYGPVHIPAHGLYITQSHNNEASQVNVRAEICNRRHLDYTLSIEVADKAGTVVCTNAIANDNHLSLTVPNPEKWSADEPNLYRVTCRIIVDGVVTDTESCQIGLREIRVDKDKGLFVNGRPVTLKGVNLHHDCGCVGSAVPESMWRRRLAALKEIGVNAIRTSHNPPAAEFLNLCDSMGFYVIDEAFDKWKSGYYATLFDAHWKEDLNAMLRRDRNHPSVIIWSVGNEVSEQFSETIFDMLPQLVGFVHENEPTRPVTCVFAPAGPKCEGTEAEKRQALIQHLARAARCLDVYGGNYQEPWYELIHELSPETPIIGSEVFIYYKGTKELIKAYRPMIPPAYGDKGYVLGEFLWTGIDYLGEGSGWPSKGWSGMLMDTAGQIKPAGRFYQSLWSAAPMVSIAVFEMRPDDDVAKLMWHFPFMSRSWNQADYAGRTIRIATFTNCEYVELILNDSSLSRQYLKDSPEKMITWHVPYAAGTLVAKGYIGDKCVCLDEIKTAGAPHALSLSTDVKTASWDGKEVFHVTAAIMDEEGLPVPYSSELIHFDVVGPGRILGVDNGWLSSDQPLKSNWHDAHDGRLMAVIMPFAEGEIIVNANSPTLLKAQIVLNDAKPSRPI